jgi:hypothetical protein
MRSWSLVCEMTRRKPIEKNRVDPAIEKAVRGLRHTRAPHDLIRAVAISRRQHDFGAPDRFSLTVAVVDDGLEPRAIRTAEEKTDVIAPQCHGMSDLRPDGNHLL